MDALRRLHNDIQDPLWDAMAGQEGSAATPQTYATQDTSQATRGKRAKPLVLFDRTIR